MLTWSSKEYHLLRGIWLLRERREEGARYRVLSLSFWGDHEGALLTSYAAGNIIALLPQFLPLWSQLCNCFEATCCSQLVTEHGLGTGASPFLKTPLMGSLSLRSPVGLAKPLFKWHCTLILLAVLLSRCQACIMLWRLSSLFPGSLLLHHPHFSQ